MSSLVVTIRRRRVAVLSVNNPPVNALSPGVPEALVVALDAAESDPDVTAIVIAGHGRTFIAGADIASLERAAWGDRSAAADLHGLLQRIENARLPIVMAVHGTALGGGLELAMAGHYRVAIQGALLGQPEVNLGIIPGAEGTQRLPRLVGIDMALDMCVTGKPLKAPDAHAAGLIDAVIGDDDLIAGAVAFAENVVGRPHPKTRERIDRLGPAEEHAPRFGAARELAARVRRQQLAPLRAVDAIEAAATLPFDQGCRRERDLFFECVESEQAKALIHLFFAERAVAKLPGSSPETAPRALATVGIVGAGTMGTGIAMTAANAGLQVRITDTIPEALDAGIARIRQNYDLSITRGRLTRDEVEARMSRITPVPGYSGFETVDVAVEAVFEQLDLKTQIARELDARLPPGAILATNTSTLDIDAIAAATSRPDAVIGLHFFSPAQVMRLVEIVRGRATSTATTAAALAIAKRLGKVGVVVGNAPAFVGNRMMLPYMYETQMLVEDGATPEQVDRALTEFGMTMGMFAVDDMAGLDVAARVRAALGFYPLRGTRQPSVQDRLCERGWVGQKAGRGWYRYDGGRVPVPDPEVVAIIEQVSVERGLQRRAIDEQEIVDRAIYTLVNEGARILDEGLVRRASDIDVIYANGYGFPAWRGGPMFFADRVGLDRVLARISMFERQFGERWTPAPLLVSLAADGRTFRDLDRAGRRESSSA